MALNQLIHKYEAQCQTVPDTVRLRVHRCLSWLKKADKSHADLDIRFISLWIAFNAAYAKDYANNENAFDRLGFRNFIGVITRQAHDEAKELVWKKYPNSVRLLMDNQYVFQPFWQYQNGLITEDVWLLKFKESKQKAHQSLANQDMESVLFIVFERLYTLRNQIFHGGSSYNSSVNREQLKDACNLLADCLYLFVSVMIDHADLSEWGKPFYPYIEE